MNINSAIIHGAKVLKDNLIKNPYLDSEILMTMAIEKDRKYILLNSKRNLDKEDLNTFQKLIKKRSIGKPIAYLTNKKFFWNSEFAVSDNILIPRPDTELVIEKVLDLTANKKKLNILEIGIGSGCILLSILKERKSFYGTGIDISKSCLKISKLNAIKLKLTSKLKLFKSNVDKFNFGKYDLIISNPPYISRTDLKYLDNDVVNFEPKLALDGGLDGLSEIRKVVTKSSELIKKNGKLILEIGFKQSEKVKRILKSKGFYIDKVLKDYANNNRCIVSIKQ